MSLRSHCRLFVPALAIASVACPTWRPSVGPPRLLSGKVLALVPAVPCELSAVTVAN